jgi:hypothetical protein
MPSDDLEQRVRHLETVTRNLTEARAAQMAALTAFVRILGSKNLLTDAEVRHYCLAAIDQLPEDHRKGVAGETLRFLSTALASRVQH